MARASLTIKSGEFEKDSDAIERDFFGGNFLFDRDRVGEDGTFDEKAEALNVSFIRYPGGTITEKFFDLADPDRTVAPETRTGELTPLSEFMAYISEIGGTSSIVLPTLRYAQELRQGVETKASLRAEIRGFLEDLKAGKYGDAARITHLEIGNEYYGDGGFISDDAKVYARIARLFAEEIRGVFGDDVKTAVQAGLNAADNDIIMKAFEGQGKLVDSVVIHSYPWDLGQIGLHVNLKSYLADLWLENGLAESVFLSEWNISNQYTDPDGIEIGQDRIEDGLARAVAMIEMAAGFISAGVDYGAVWPLQQNTRGDLAGDEGETAERRANKLSEDGLTPVGKAFQLMSESLPGMRKLELDGVVDVDAKVESARREPEALVHAFEDSSKIVIFVSAWDIDDATGFVDLTLNIGGRFTDYDVTTLTIAGENYLERNADPLTFTEEDIAFDGAITLRLARDYEIKRIVLNKPEGVEISGDGILLGGAGADTLLAGEGDDVARGFGGDDLIRGSDGFDFIAAGGGRDRVQGGGGDDVIRGGGGADRLMGGGGADLLFGGGGEDLLKGGAGHDTLNGGGRADNLIGGGGKDRLEASGGADRLTGGGGQDVFVADGGPGLDRVIDFRFGRDQLEFDAVDSFSALNILDHAEGALISGGGERLLILGANARRFDTEDFIF